MPGGITGRGIPKETENKSSDENEESPESGSLPDPKND